MRRSLVAAGMLAVATIFVAPAASFADSTPGTIVVRGAAFPDERAAQLSFVGCSDLYDRSSEAIQPYLALGPGTAPLGERSVGYDLGGGNAIGSLNYVNSMAATTVAGLSVYAGDGAAGAGAAGVAYAGYQMPSDSGTSLVWLGRAALQASPGVWQQVDATTLTYAWTQYDMATGRPTPSQSATQDGTLDATVDGTVGGAVDQGITDFMAGHGGDGPGFFTVGFGCDGNAFSMDAWRIGGPSGVTTYDLEGLTTVTTITGSPGSTDSIVAGDSAVIGGAVRDGAGNKLFRATMILEAKAFGSDDFTTVEVAEAAGAIDPSVTVAPTARTVYRWRFAARPLAEGSESAPFTIEVATRVTATVTDTGTDPEAGTGQRIEGGTSPAKPDLLATLWLVTPEGDSRVDTSRTASDGTFSFEVPDAQTRPGTDRYYVSVPAASGNLAARSPNVEIRVTSRDR